MSDTIWNTICIKHGKNEPGSGVLQPYELGYVTSTGTLVIGNIEQEAIKLNYLPLDNKGYIPEKLSTKGNLTIESNEGVNPRILLKIINDKFQTNPEDPTTLISTGRVGYSLTGSTGQAFIIEQPPGNHTNYERYELPAPNKDATKSTTYKILTTKGGTKLSGDFGFTGDFNFTGEITSGKITVGGPLVLTQNVSYGYNDPNSANIKGTPGQIYFYIS